MHKNCFNPRAPCGARPSGSSSCVFCFWFQSTRPMRGATRRAARQGKLVSVSIHAPHAGRDAARGTCPMGTACFNPRAPCGARQDQAGCSVRSECFNPRAPCGARHGLTRSSSTPKKFQSTRPMRGATGTMIVSLRCDKVSIHAPHAGRDRRYSRRPLSNSRFNPRAPCGARRLRPRGERKRQPCFNPRAPCGARPRTFSIVSVTKMFQSTRPMRGATTVKQQVLALCLFQSTRPMRGATMGTSLSTSSAGVSIHAPHAGRDRTGRLVRTPSGSFNPRAPCGARRMWLSPSSTRTMFQSTRPMRGATRQHREQQTTGQFQSTRPMRGATAAPCRDR